LPVAKIVLTSSICMQSLVEIDKRTATGERKTSFFVCLSRYGSQNSALSMAARREKFETA